MRHSRIILPLLGTAMLAVPAFAQTSPTAPATPPAANPSVTAPAPSSAMPATGAASSMRVDMADKWRASQIEGVDIYGPNNEKVGEVTELLMDRNGSVEAIVVGVGGFLGVGQRDIAIPFSQVQWSDTPMAGASASAPAGGAGTASGTTASGGTAMNAPATTGTTAARPAPTAGTAGTAASNRRMYPDHGKITLTREQLQAAPEVTY